MSGFTDAYKAVSCHLHSRPLDVVFGILRPLGVFGVIVLLGVVFWAVGHPNRLGLAGEAEFNAEGHGSGRPALG